MKNLQGHLDVFLITNGRSTFKHAYQALLNQEGVKFRLIIVRDKPWIEANNFCVANCKSRFFLRVDDDMFLHPKAVLYINERLRKQSRKMAVMIWKLWEPWSRTRVNGIKAYNKGRVKRLGGFKANRLGKIDKVFMKKVRSSKYTSKGDKSIVGIHAACDPEESIRYAKMRGEDKGKDFKKKERRLGRMAKYTRTQQEQFDRISRTLERHNRKVKSDFLNYIVKK